MSGIITSGSFPKNKRPGVFAFTQMEYKEHPEYWRECFYVTTSKLAYEEAVAGNSFGLAPVKGEGANIEYASESQAHTTRSTHVVYAMGYIITMEESDDDLYEKLGMRRGSRLAKSFIRTKETVHANLFNRAFNSTYTFGDAKELCATDHATLNGSQSNELATAADMSEASIEDLCIQIRKATDNVGNRIALKEMKLLYAPDEKFNATRILNSEKQNDSANNATNALKSMGSVPYHMDNPYLDDGDAWFILTDIAQTEEGLVHFERKPFQVGLDNDSDTLNEKHFGYERYSRTAFDFRSVYGSPGA